MGITSLISFLSRLTRSHDDDAPSSVPLLRFRFRTFYTLCHRFALAQYPCKLNLFISTDSIPCLMILFPFDWDEQVLMTMLRHLLYYNCQEKTNQHPDKENRTTKLMSYKKRKKNNLQRKTHAEVLNQKQKEKKTKQLNRIKSEQETRTECKSGELTRNMWRKT